MHSAWHWIAARVPLPCRWCCRLHRRDTGAATLAEVLDIIADDGEGER